MYGSMGAWGHGTWDMGQAGHVVCQGKNLIYETNYCAARLGTICRRRCRSIHRAEGKGWK